MAGVIEDKRNDGMSSMNGRNKHATAHSRSAGGIWTCFRQFRTVKATAGGDDFARTRSMDEGPADRNRSLDNSRVWRWGSQGEKFTIQGLRERMRMRSH